MAKISVWIIQTAGNLNSSLDDFCPSGCCPSGVAVYAQDDFEEASSSPDFIIIIIIQQILRLPNVGEDMYIDKP